VSTTTVSRNARNRIAFLRGHLAECKVYTLENGFQGKAADPSFAWDTFDRNPRTKLVTGTDDSYTIHVHDNLWYELSATQAKGQDKAEGMTETTENPAVAAPYQLVDTIRMPGGVLEVGFAGSQVVMQLHGGRQVRLTAKGREQFQRAFMDAERGAEAHGKVSG
jgi:hypothetical protein